MIHSHNPIVLSQFLQTYQCVKSYLVIPNNVSLDMTSLKSHVPPNVMDYYHLLPVIIKCVTKSKKCSTYFQRCHIYWVL